MKNIPIPQTANPIDSTFEFKRSFDIKIVIKKENKLIPVSKV